MGWLVRLSDILAVLTGKIAHFESPCLIIDSDKRAALHFRVP